MTSDVPRSAAAARFAVFVLALEAALAPGAGRARTARAGGSGSAFAPPERARPAVTEPGPTRRSRTSTGASQPRSV